jgi:hypothetical protein
MMTPGIFIGHAPRIVSAIVPDRNENSGGAGLDQRVTDACLANPQWTNGCFRHPFC